MVFGSKYDKYESLEPTYPAFQLRIAEDLRVVEADALPSALDKSTLDGRPSALSSLRMDAFGCRGFPTRWKNMKNSSEVKGMNRYEKT